MDTPFSPIDSLRPSFERLRAAQLAHISTYAERREALDRLGLAVRRHRDALVQACSEDFGRRAPLETLGADVMVTLDEIKHARKHLRRWMRPTRRAVNLTFKPARAEMRYAPLGVVGIVSPWNYPFQLALVPMVNALAAGNRVMIKPSEFTPKVSALMARLLAEVFPPDQVVLVQGDADLAAAFTQLPFDHLLFTGSTAVGRHVMAAAAPNLTPVTLELGGKSPTLIAPDYPVEHAADRIAFGKCFNAGQTCVAPDYVLVPRAKRDAFVSALMASFARRYPTLADNPDYTAVVNSRQATRLRDWIAEARARGTEVLQYLPAGETLPTGVEIVPPTVLLDPPLDCQAMQQEIFGPVLPVISYDSHDAALAFILARDKPLAFYPFDRDKTRLARSLDRISAGTVCVNDVIIQFGQDELPVGGVGASGMGHYHGHAGFLTFSKSMPVMYQSRLNGMFLFDAPYSDLARRAVAWLTR
ncbi:MAG TPA: coniferyl aldehyde dehydrogenase [Arenimonas sp.]|uniref:coniferyl aldehyde dehydrogenase n=1 Tax=Arenimonas sp. TaxID=1872635 RepID=UPI002C4CA7BF|nr:coniferyl aldehyde dehydrogenase [Arenimonas sp.]HMB56279.1 coniferyl aldehyde dehydrogenase [Arenimonas sp.]